VNDSRVGLVHGGSPNATVNLDSFLGRCAADPMTLRIKRADINDKLSLGPGDGLGAADVARVHTPAGQRLELLEHLAPDHS
jgi:hypothetical protein